MKVYTKSGDKGQTALIGGTRVAKHDCRVEAYGTLDELGAHVALLREMLREKGNLSHDEALLRVMRELMQVEAALATDLAVERVAQMALSVKGEWVERLEAEIDAMSAQLSTVFRFTVPGGSVTIAQCHVCRTVCRRAERCATRVAEECEVSEVAMSYINRLSDWLYSLGRVLHIEEGVEEIECLGE